MRVVVIGGTGHIGTHLVPSLVRDGHDVVVVSRGNRKPYTADKAWSSVEMLTCNRIQAETDGTFAPIIAARKPPPTFFDRIPSYWLISRLSRTSNPTPHAPTARRDVRTW